MTKKRMTNRTDVYADERELNPRHVDHFAMRTMNPGAMADFYVDVFGFERVASPDGDPNRYLTDGHLTMVIMPWAITDFDGTGIVSPSMDHIGFRVESLAAFKADVALVGGGNPFLATSSMQVGPEAEVRIALAQRSCPHCTHLLVDIDGIIVSASERG